MPKEMKQSLEEENNEGQTNGLDDSATNSALNNSFSTFNDAHLDLMHVSTDSASSNEHEHQSRGTDSDTLLEEIGYSESMEEVERAVEEKEKVVANDPKIEVNREKPVYKFPNLWPKTSREALLFDDNERSLNIPDNSCDVAKNSENENKDASTSRESVLQVESVPQINTKSVTMAFHTHSKPKLTDHTMQVHDNSVNTYGTKSKDIQEFENKYLQEAFGQKDDFAISHPPPHFAASQNMDKPTHPITSDVSKPEMLIKSEMIDNFASNSKANPLKIKRSISSKKNKCGVCNARLGICAIRCRCGNLYCSKHRYDRDHNCTFDYRAMGADEIRKNNPQVIADKVRKL